MMKSKNTNGLSGINRFAVVSAFILLFLSLSGKETIIMQDIAMVSISNYQHETIASDENPLLKFESITNLHHYFRDDLRYPQEARALGETGTVELFLRVNSTGMIDEVMEIQPEEDFIIIPEIVIVSYSQRGHSQINIEKTEPSTPKSLISESLRVVNNIQKLEIPELYGKTIKLQFRFRLQ